MVYRILKDGQEVNTIVADAAFVAAYCEKYGYTYEFVREAAVEVAEPVSDTDVLNMLLGVDE